MAFRELLLVTRHEHRESVAALVVRDLRAPVRPQVLEVGSGIAEVHSRHLGHLLHGKQVLGQGPIEHLCHETEEVPFL